MKSRHAIPVTFVALVARAVELGLPKTFATDLQMHDLKACRDNHPVRRFLWCIGETGTTLIWLDPKKGERFDRSVGSVTRSRAFVRTLEEERPFFHFWNGRDLEQIDSPRLHEQLVDGPGPSLDVLDALLGAEIAELDP